MDKMPISILNYSSGTFQLKLSLTLFSAVSSSCTIRPKSVAQQDTMPLDLKHFPVHFSWVNIMILRGLEILLLQNVYLTRSFVFLP